MASRDYKDQGGPARGGRGAPKRKGGSPIAVGIVIGVLLGLAAALGVALFISKGPSPFTDRKSAPATAPAAESKPEAKPTAKAAEAEKPQPAGTTGRAPVPPKAVSSQDAKSDTGNLTFYGILEGREQVLPGKGPLPSVPPNERKIYLQVGAFHSASEADDLKAQLALSGVEAKIQAVRLSPGDKLVHRVRLGPFNAEEALRSKKLLEDQKIEAIVIYVQEKPSPR